MARMLALLTVGCMPMTLTAQKDNDFGIWTDIKVDKKINSKSHVSLGAELRTNDNSSQTKRWAVSLAGDYHITPMIRLGAGYDFLYDRRESTTYDADGDAAKYANYWTPRHRLHADITGKWEIGRWEVSLRERWQYTYRPEKTIDGQYDYARQDFDGVPQTVKGNGKHLLRSRLQLTYDLGRWEPHASVEIHNAWRLEKTRFSIGTDWAVSKAHKIGFYYRYQVEAGFTGEPNLHILGVSYKVKI